MRHSLEQRARFGDVQLRSPELPHLRLLDAPSERVDEQLHAVADAHDRNPELEQAHLQRRGAGSVDRSGAAGEDDAARFSRGHLLEGHVVREQLAEDAAVAHPARDQLGVLPAVVQDEDLLHRRLDRRRGAGKRRRRDGVGLVEQRCSRGTRPRVGCRRARPVSH